jgi:signal peptidase I
MSGDDKKRRGQELETMAGIFCRGDSMRPLFRPGDRIQFVPCCIEDLRRGDVIIFIPPGQNERVVHRVVSTKPDGIRTKGDANSYRDAWGLRQEDIVGRAVSVERGGRVIPVAGGIAGRLLASLIRAVRTSDHFASHVLSPCYRGLARSGLFRMLLPTALRPKVITFERDGHREMQLVLGRRIIGRLTADAGAWAIRRPFRLIVEEGSLPTAQKSGDMDSLF